MTGDEAPGDPFGLRSLDLAELRNRPGAKWHRPAGRLAAWVADMDFPVAPEIRDRLTVLASSDLGYPDWPRTGASPLPAVFADRMSRRFGWTPAVDRLHELADVIQGVRLAIHHLTDPGDRVVVHTPAYPPFLDSIRAMDRRLVPVSWPFDHDDLDERLRHEPARLLVLCHPHNPTGHVFDRRELEHLAHLAMRHGLAVISDEIHADLTFEPHEHLPFASLSDEVAARTVTVTSSSKAFNLAGLRWAILHAGDDRLQRLMVEVPEHYFGTPNVMAVAATDAAWSTGDEWLRAVMAVLDENRRRLVALLDRHLPGADYRMPSATYLAWLDCRRLEVGDDPAAMFRRRGVEVSPGWSFGPEGRGFVRINLATSPAILEQVVTAMGQPDIS